MRVYPGSFHNTRPADVPPVAILSAARPGMSAAEAERVTRDLEQDARRTGYEVRRGKGMYQGKREPAVVLYGATGTGSYGDLLGTALMLARKYRQETVFMVNGERRCFLVNTGEGRGGQALGRLHASPTVPAEADGWTYLPHLKTYYYTMPGALSTPEGR